MKNIQPQQDRILLKGSSDIDTSASGIIIPETAKKDRPQKAVVVAVGPGKRDENGKIHPLEVNVGDVVIFSKYAPDEVQLDGEDFIIAREDHILAIIKN
jgi:chaperonin GroES